MDSPRCSMLVLLAAASVAVAASAMAPAQDEKVQVGVYYETLCPDSKKFVTDQLYPVYLSPLGPKMNLTLVPYGKATMSKNETTGAYNFTCHHGDMECWGNKVHACAIEKLDLNMRLKFINCTMAIAEKDKEYPLKMCADELKMGDEELVQCANSTMGDELLAKMGEMTQNLENPLTGVPTIVFNNKLNKTEINSARTDFKKELCSKMMGDKPKECMAAPGAASSVVLAGSLVPALAALLLAAAY